MGDVAGICGILGSTYTGEYEDIEQLDQLVEKLNKEKVSPLECCCLPGWLFFLVQMLSTTGASFVCMSINHSCYKKN